MSGKNKTPKNIKRKLNNKRYIIDDNTPFVITEAYKMARTNLIFSLSTSNNRVVVFTSCNPAEGKSTNCVNLAITLANTGSKVLIIDSDLRKPTMHKLLKLPNEKGLSSIISGQCSINDARIKNIRDNLDIITAGPIPPNPSELLSSQKMVVCLELLQSKYDYICIDTPPINVVSDALLYNSITSGMIFIVRENITRHTDISDALTRIRMTNGKVLGFIKTSCDPQAKSTGNYKAKYDYSSGKSGRKAQ